MIVENAAASSYERCKVSNETCILKAANDLLHGSYEGIFFIQLSHDCFFVTFQKKLFILHAGNSDIALSSIDPIKAKVLRVIQDSGPVEIEATMINFEIQGFSKGEFYRFGGFDRNVLEIGLRTPAGVFRGPYKINGRILVIPVIGDGNTTTKFCEFFD